MARQLDELIESPAPAPPPDVGERPLYFNRELSLLDFQERVLALAEDDGLPLLERVKFLAIFAGNLDELFQIRVAGLKDQVAAGVGGPSEDGPAKTLVAIRAALDALLARQEKVFRDQIVPALGEAGIRICQWSDLGEEDRKQVQVVYDDIFPVLTPLAVDPGHPFPYISNLSLNLAVIVRDPVTSERRFARVKVPQLLPRFVALPDGERFVPLEQVIAAHLDTLFPGMEIECHYPFRVTRNTDLTLQEAGEEAEDLLAAVEMELRRRRFGKAVRLEIDHDMSEEARSLLERELEVEPDDVYVVDGPLGLTNLWSLHELDRPDLKDEPWHPVTPAGLNTAVDHDADVLSLVRERDVLVHHPYDAFASTVEAFIRQAAADPKVLAIKQTLYRTSGDSPIVEALIRAAEQGKQVSALVELKARFDEQANIAWARALEEAGVHVVYGLVGFKTHSKTALVVRQDDDGIRRYCHVGTGNYNPKTARIYEDLGLLTCDPEIGADLTDLFNFLTGYSRQQQFRKLLLAPTQLRARMVELVDKEAAKGKRGRIVMKMNNLVDKAVIDALYRASAAGTSVDLVVRSICCLRPGVAGLSENIRVRSIVGRYLEHSRIYAFGRPEDGEVRWLIGSADMMPRNLDNRIEALVPVASPPLQARLAEILEVALADDVLAWELGGDGRWTKVETTEGLSCQARLQELALERQRRESQALVADIQ